MQVDIWYQRASKPPGERIHTDVCGLLQCSLSSLRYFVLFVDSIYRNVYFLEIELRRCCGKSYTILASAKTTGRVIKEIVSDNGGEFHENNTARDIFLMKGLNRTLSNYTVLLWCGRNRQSVLDSFLVPVSYSQPNSMFSVHKYMSLIMSRFLIV